MLPMPDDDEQPMSSTAHAGNGQQRLDKWLWFVRMVKTRTLASGLVTGGRVRVNRERVTKPSHTVRVGDVVTVSVGARVRVLEMLAPGVRRGPPTEARELYRDLTPPSAQHERESPGVGMTGQRDSGAGRPTKRDRRRIDRLHGSDGDQD
ncbi:MAG: RNA-binding S4 domain-containing protein [Hyphomicrobiaceae bacterium]